jgi:hypothetical protein
MANAFALLAEVKWVVVLYWLVFIGPKNSVGDAVKFSGAIKK